MLQVSEVALVAHRLEGVVNYSGEVASVLSFILDVVEADHPLVHVFFNIQVAALAATAGEHEVDQVPNRL